MQILKTCRTFLRALDRHSRDPKTFSAAVIRACMVSAALLSMTLPVPASAATIAATITASQKLSQRLIPQPDRQSGQSATQLPDGRWLLLGGQGANSVATVNAAILTPKTNVITALGAQLNQARSGHTATLLPNGTVLILGGVDANGSVLPSAEQFDPVTQQFQVLSEPGLIARVGHTATVLANGMVFIAGGQDARGRAIYDAELYNPFTRQAEHFNARLDTVRMHHVAALLPSANVLLFGGLDSLQKPLQGGDVFDFASHRFIPVTADAVADISKNLSTGKIPGIKDSQPLAEAQDAPVDRPIVVRFNQRMAVATMGPDTVTLIGPHGAVAIQPVAVEYGLLLFITPQQDLLPGSRYTLFINGAQDEAGQALPFLSIGFNTARMTQAKAVAASSVLANASSPNASNAPTGTSAIQNTPSTTAYAQREQQAATGTIDAATSAAANDEAWIPNASHFKGDWRAKRGDSAQKSLPSLAAPPGETALAGQVLTLDGKSLPNVTLTIGKQMAQSDATGRFLLRNLSPGVQVLFIDGASAGNKGSQYGFYQVKVSVEAGKTTALDYTIWSPKLDAAGNIKLSSPTAQETVVTSPRIPGLELRIPAGTVIRDHNGKIVTEINMTAIPTDRPPFPIPGVGVPVYFTVQPGGATLTSTSGSKQQGAQLIYPNFSGAAPGSRIDFWNYDAQGKGWYVYGQGTVTKDGKQVMPDAGVAIYEFTGAMISLPSNAPPDAPPAGGCGSNGGGAAASDDCNGDPNQPPQPSGCGGDPVDCATGLFLNAGTDLFVNDVIPLKVARSYRPRDPASRAFGIGTNLSYDIFLVGDTSPWTYQDLILPDGGRIHYARTSVGTSYSDAVYGHTATPTKYYGSTIRRGSGSCYWNLQLKDGSQMCFPESMSSNNARAAAAISLSDRYGNTLSMTRDISGNLTKVISPSGRFIQFTYDISRRITSATDNIGRAILYQYDTGGHLIKVTDPTGKFEAFTYDASHNMLTVQDKRGNLMVTNVYDASNRVRKQTYADGTTNLFTYVADAAGKVTQTDVTNERGFVTRMAFNAGGYLTKVTKALAQPQQQIVSIERNVSTNLLLSQTDALGRKTAYTYDATGNLVTQTFPAGAADAVTTSMTYSANFNQRVSVTDALAHITTITYDLQGNPVQMQDANGNLTSSRYNAAGQPVELTDPLGKRTSLTYDGYDLSIITDPLSRTLTLFNDGAGRTRSKTDSLGNRTVYELDALDRMTRHTDPLLQSTASGFDGNDNQTQIQDAKGNAHAFVFDKRNALTTATNPLLKAESYVYDARHNLTKRTDRKGQATQYAYDALDRLTTITYADASTVRMTYDQGNRLTQIVDSVNGTITRNYDSFDRVTQVTTIKGSIGYTYYANGLRQTMTITGQPTLTYTYDAGNRLTRISQAAGTANNNLAQTITFAYDANNRRTQTTYANGITRSNGYDAAGQLLSIAYKKADASVIGDLSYTYDKGGRRITVGGTLARVALPGDLTSATVDAANRLTGAGAQTFGYDANGNLISDGSQIYVWNARNQLMQIKNASGTVTASFSYDAMGRRQTKTVNGVASGYVYDGVNIVQELAGVNVDNRLPANVRASYISGGVDEVFAQQSGTGASAKIATYLTDALGSTVQLTDAAGAKMADYTYDPYGSTSVDAVVNNPFQYTGRENDGNGLYYYRARYYSPGMARFISSDPIGLAGGINTFAYVGGNPVSRRDPSGLLSVVEIGVTVGVGLIITQTPIGRQIMDNFGTSIWNAIANSKSDDPVVYPDNPDEAEKRFRNIRGTRGQQCDDGSVWERDKSSHGGDQWKRWPNKGSWERGDTPNSVWPDGRVRK